MINAETIEKIKQFLSLYHELTNELPALDIFLDNSHGHVFMAYDDFFREFSQYKVSLRDDEKYPYQFTAEVDGIIVYAIGEENPPVLYQEGDQKGLNHEGDMYGLPQDTERR